MINVNKEYERLKKEKEDMMVNHPPHYNKSNIKCECDRQIECIDVTRNFNFNIGNAIKYLWRCEHKANKVEDLKKALWYINDELDRCQR